MPVTLELTDAEIDRVRECALLDSITEARDLCATRLTTDAEVTAVKEDVVAWNKVRINVNDVIPNNNNEIYVRRAHKRKLLRWGLRDRLGLPPVSDKETEMDAALNGSSGEVGMQRGTLRMQTGRAVRTASEF